MTKLAAFEHGAVIARVLSPLIVGRVVNHFTPGQNTKIQLPSGSLLWHHDGWNGWWIHARVSHRTFNIYSSHSVISQRGQAWPQWASLQEVEAEQEVWPEQERGAGRDEGPGGGAQAPLMTSCELTSAPGADNVAYFWWSVKNKWQTFGWKLFITSRRLGTCPENII